MAATFVRIAFQEDAWTSQYEPSHRYIFQLSAAAELVHYFLRFPFVMNEAFSHFVSRRLLGPIASLRGYNVSLNPALSMILDAFITGLESDVLNPEMFQQSIDYLFEPENLFTVCALLLMRLSTRSALRRLALLRRDDPAWPECLMQLDTFPAHFEVSFHPSAGPHAISDLEHLWKEDASGSTDWICLIRGHRDRTTMERPSGSFAVENQVMAESAWPHSGTNVGDARLIGDGQV